MRLLKVKLVSGLPMDINPAHVESAFAIIDARAKVKKGDPAPEVVKVTMSSGNKMDIDMAPALFAKELNRHANLK